MMPPKDLPNPTATKAVLEAWSKAHPGWVPVYTIVYNTDNEPNVRLVDPREYTHVDTYEVSPGIAQRNYWRFEGELMVD